MPSLKKNVFIIVDRYSGTGATYACLQYKNAFIYLNYDVQILQYSLKHIADSNLSYKDFIIKKIYLLTKICKKFPKYDIFFILAVKILKCIFPRPSDIDICIFISAVEISLFKKYFSEKTKYIFSHFAPVNYTILTEFRSENDYLLFYRQSDLVIFESRNEAELFNKRFSFLSGVFWRTSVNIPHSIYISSFDRFQSKSIVILASVQFRKGIHYAIDIISKISKTFPSIILHIIGGIHDINYYKNLKYQVSLLNIEKNVIFHGYREDYLEILVSSTLLISTSISEGFATALRESICYSIPILCFDLPCANDILKNEIPECFIEPFNINQFEENILQLLSSYEIYKKTSEKIYEFYCRNLQIESLVTDIKKSIQNF